MTVMPLATTALYAAINVLIMMAIAVQIPGQRRRTQTGLGLGEDHALRWRVRAHANNCEYVPFALLLIGLLELGGQPLWLLHALGIALTLGRILHPIGLSKNPGVSWQRVGGMVLTWTSLIVAALVCLYMALAG